MKVGRTHITIQIRGIFTATINHQFSGDTTVSSNNVAPCLSQSGPDSIEKLGGSHQMK